MHLELLLTIGRLAAEATLLGILARRRILHALPVFCASVTWNFITDAMLLFAQYSLNNRFFFRLYEVETVLDAVLQYLVIVELSWAILKPILKDSGRITLWMQAGLIALTVLLLWCLIGMVLPSGFEPDAALLFQLHEMIAILQVLFVVTVSIVSRVLSLSWKRLPFQVIAGLGIYSFVSLFFSTLHERTQQSAGTQKMFGLLLNLTYIGVLVCWILCVRVAPNEFDKREHT